MTQLTLTFKYQCFRLPYFTNSPLSAGLVQLLFLLAVYVIFDNLIQKLYNLYHQLLMFCARYGVVIAVWIFIITDFSIYTPLFLPALYNYDIITFYLMAPLFLWCTLSTIYCYYKSIFTSPGSPPDNINDSYDDIEAIKLRSKQQEEIKKNKRRLKYQPTEQQPQFDEIQALGRTSYCFKCEKIKQPRTHHCKICGNCVLRMDHHCPWVGNCVGLYNHKYFMIFLFCSSTGLLIIFASIGIDFFMGQPVAGQLSQIQQLLVYSSCVVSGLLGLAIGFLFVTQMYGLSKNVTTIESFTEFMMQREPFRKDSFRENMEQIMGKSFWLWPSSSFSISKPYTSI